MDSYTYSRLKSKSPLTMEPGFTHDNESNKRITIATAGGDKVKVTLPTIQLDNCEQTLFALAEFDDTATQYAFDGGDKFLYFRQVLTITVKQEWDAIVDGTAHTNNKFSIHRTTLLRQLFTNESLDYYIDYIRAYKKPSTMSARATYLRYKVIDTYKNRLPQAVPTPDMERKRQFLHMFPDDQQNAFRRVKPDLNNVTLVEMADFFATYDKPNSSSSATKKRNNEDGSDNHGNSSDKAKDGKRYRKQRDNRFGKNKKHRGTSNNNGRDGTKSTNASMCGLHKHLGSDNHLWHNCVFNKNGPNYNEAADRRRREKLGQNDPTRSRGSIANGNQQGTPLRDANYHVDQFYYHGRVPQASNYQAALPPPPPPMYPSDPPVPPRMDN